MPEVNLEWLNACTSYLNYSSFLKEKKLSLKEEKVFVDSLI